MVLNNCFSKERKEHRTNSLFIAIILLYSKKYFNNNTLCGSDVRSGLVSYSGFLKIELLTDSSDFFNRTPIQEGSCKPETLI